MSSGEVDRDSDLYLAYEQLASVKKKTREQKAQLRELEWYTRLYCDEKIGPYIPGKNVKELLRSAATKFRDGENVKRGLVIPEYRIPLIYDGPRNPKELWKAGFRYTAMVANAGAGSGRVDRTRPCFDEWKLSFEVAFDQEELDKDHFETIVKRTVETAEAVFEVDDYENYVHVQSESALRNLTTSYPYDAHDEHLISLRGHTNTVADHLKREIQERLAKAGVEVIEARISHLAYAPEIAAAMLQRQQAGAIIAARQRIVEGAVGMVEMALGMLSQKKIVTLDDERKAAMVSNLLVVLCGERGAQPILNTGTIYQ
jgi:hypothetical protein